MQENNTIIRIGISIQKTENTALNDQVYSSSGRKCLKPYEKCNIYLRVFYMETRKKEIHDNNFQHQKEEGKVASKICCDPSFFMSLKCPPE